MKYPQLVSSTTPASLRDWLEEELESRGIDGVYTRYILSLLQQDSLDLDLPECDHLTKLQQKCPLQVGSKEQTPLHLVKSRHKRWKSWERERLHKPEYTNYCSCGLALNFEERRKTAAVECLKSASEQKYGIEKLIDELCTKLKNIGSPQGGIQNGTRDSESTTVELESIPHASPKEQAEKYYAAFPALSGKTEPLTKLCHQQERGPAFRSVWDGRHVIWHCQENGRLNAIEDDCTELKLKRRRKREDSSDRESNASEKENEIASKENDGGRIVTKHRKFGDKCREVPFGQSGSRKPAFIIPKMKTASSRVPLTVKHSPFNPSVTKQTSKTKIWVETRKANEPVHDKKDSLATLGTDGNVSIHPDHVTSCSDPLSPHCEDIISKLLEDSVIELCEVDGSLACCCPIRNVLGGCSHDLGLVLSSSVSNVQQHCTEDMVTQLIDKFDNSLAAIWGSDDISVENSTYWTETSGSLSFTVFPLKSLDKETFPTPPTSIYSVWSVGGEDLEIFKLSDPNDIVSSAEYPSKSHSLAAGIISGVLNGLQSSKNSDLNKGVSPVSEAVDTFNNSERLHPDPLLAVDLEEDLDHILSNCPDTYFTNLSDCSEPSPRNCANPSPDESFMSSSTGIYTLWECSSADLHLTLGIKASTPWHSLHLGEPSNGRWKLSGPHGIKDSLGGQVTSHDDLSVSDSLSLVNTSHVWSLAATKQSPCKKNCTLLYHKGESRFVEVIPSGKSKQFAAEDFLVQHDQNETLKRSGLEEEVEAEENLLTSSKTHFQPIRQDSTESESIELEIASTLEISKQRKFGPLRDQAGAAELYPSTLPLQFQRTLTEHLLDKDLHEMASFSPLSERCSSDSSSRSSFKVLKVRSRALSSSYDELMSLMGPLCVEETTSSRSSCSSSPEGPALPFCGWQLDTYKDKSTNTEFLPPYSLPSIQTNTPGLKCQKFQQSTIEQVLSPFSDEEDEWDSDLLESGEVKMPTWRTGWSLADDDHCSWTPCSQSNSSTHVKENQELRVNDSVGNGTHCEHQNLKALRKEIEEEEEQLFRDINYLAENSNDTVIREGLEYCYSTELKEADFNQENALEAMTCLKHTNASSRIYKMLSIRSLPHSWEDSSSLSPKQFSPRACKDDFTLESEDSVSPGLIPFPTVPLEKVFFSSDLEDDWRKNSKPFDVQVPRKNSMKFRAPQKRPCSFYLEGNCRRSDCKFSHDLASITCRFWEEGCCFKGITCPFLHGYPNDPDCFFGESPPPDCSFILESEADFPSLANTSVPEIDSNILPKDKKDGKNSHLKKKRGRPHHIQALVTQPSSQP